MNIIELYNPRNAAKLTPEQVQAMQDLTLDEIKELAEAYPNQPTGNAYLKFYIKSDPADKQRFPLGTWNNLYNLRKLGKEDILPFGFVNTKMPFVQTKAGVVKRTVDLGAEEVIEGMKAVDVNTEAANDFSNEEDYAATQTEDAQAAYNEPTEAELALLAANEALQKGIEDKVHPQTIKKLERELEAAKLAVEEEE